MCAGIRVVIAENIERIYKQNCQNLGLLTSTNFSLIDRIRSGAEIALSEFTAGEDEITRQVIEYGGLFPFNVARMQGKVFLPPIESASAPRGMTLAEKIFARHMLNEKGEVGVSSVKPGDTGFARADLRFSHEYVTPMASIFFESYVGKDAKVNDPIEHPVLPRSSYVSRRGDFRGKEEVGSARFGDATQAQARGFRQEAGNSPAWRTDRPQGFRRDLPFHCAGELRVAGQLNIGSDSHTPHVGAIGCVAFGIGTTDVFNSWITKDVRVKVPESVRIVVRGKKHPNVTAKDFILKILSLDYVRSGKALAKVMEYAGEAIEELSVDERATMTNMAAEIGGFTGIVAPDKKAVDFLVERRGVDRKKAEAHDRGPIQRSGRSICQCD